MIRENQRLFNQLNVMTDGLILFVALPLAFWIRFYVLPNGIATVPLERYIALDALLALAHLAFYAMFGLYSSFRRTPLRVELPRLWLAGGIVMAAFLSLLFLGRGMHYSRLTIAIYFVLGTLGVTAKRVALRLLLRHFRSLGYNQKHVVLVGSGSMARRYLDTVNSHRRLGYQVTGYVADAIMDGDGLPPRLAGFDGLEAVLERRKPDEVVSAIETDDYHRTPQIIAACEKTGTKLSIIPFYAEYMPSNPQFDDLGGIPLLNIRRIPLDNWANAFCKRLMDVAGSALLLLVLSPVMLACAVGVKLSSPGPVFFKQERVGRNKKPFYMYKFRSMRVNDSSSTAWSTDRDDRKTKFGAFLRKCSLDELPQFFNVLKGDMSLVGPRPEIPHFVDQFKEEVPLYMVKHQVRPGITGWAQVHDLRGDTSIKARIEHDVYYIEHWNLVLDIQILFMTLFKGKFLNSEKLS